MSEKLLTLGEAKKILGVTTRTIQRWDKEGKIRIIRTLGGRRRVPDSEISRIIGEDKTVPVKILAIYARVSSHEQKAKGDLDRQVETIKRGVNQELYEQVIVITDLSSGLNDRRKGLLKLMELAKAKVITDIAITYKDRLTRFGFNYLKEYFTSHGVTIHMINCEKERKSAYEELVEDLLAIVTSFSGKLYGIRSKKKDKFTQIVREAVTNASNLPDEDQ